jgi:hypothetical protein
MVFEKVHSDLESRHHTYWLTHEYEMCRQIVLAQRHKTFCQKFTSVRNKLEHFLALIRPSLKCVCGPLIGATQWWGFQPWVQMLD